MKNIIEVKNVSYSYQTEDNITHAIRDVSFDIKEGDFVVILGHNGSGKSTLAKLLNAFLIPDEGQILVNGIATTQQDKIFEIRSLVGMVFQNPDNQMVATIIEDDIAFGPENLGLARDEIRRRVDWSLKTVGMFEHINHTPYKLSGGQKQRVSIAAVLAMLPKVLVLDESTAMLDPKGRSEVLDTIKKLNKEQNITVVLITHYMDEAVDADKILVFNDGRISISGSPYDVFSDYQTIKNAGLELPVAAKTAMELKKLGIDTGLVLTDNELAEVLCRLK